MVSITNQMQGRSLDAGDSRAETSENSMAACSCADRLALLGDPRTGSGANSTLAPEFFRGHISRGRRAREERVLSGRSNPVGADLHEQHAKTLPAQHGPL